MGSPVPLHHYRQTAQPPPPLSPGLTSAAIPPAASNPNLAGPTSAGTSSGQTLDGEWRLVDDLLQAQGPGVTLPYDTSVRRVIREQVAYTLQAYPGLRVHPATFTHNDGRQSLLLQLDGTIPMWYKSVKYNIPLVVWLLEAFPVAAPLVYVTPTRDMVIRPHHSHVDASGLVDVPYLREWVAQRSSLVDLLQMLSVTFGHEPPLFSRATAAAAASGGGGAAVHAHGSGASGSGAASEGGGRGGGAAGGGSGGGGGLAGQAYGLQHRPPSPQQQQGGWQGTNPVGRTGGRPQTGGSGPLIQSGADMSATSVRTAAGSAGVGASAGSGESPEAAFKRVALAALHKQLAVDVGERAREAAAKAESQLSVQGLLAGRQEGVIRAVQKMRREKEALEEALQVYQTNAETLEDWLVRNEVQPAAAGSEDSKGENEGIEPADPLSRQLLTCMAADLAIEDTLYALDRAVHEDGRGVSGLVGGSFHASSSSSVGPVISLDMYLRTVRELSRKQFFHRATALKVQAAQHSERVNHMASSHPAHGPSGY